MFKEQFPPCVLVYGFSAILSLVAVIRPAPFKQQRHAGSGQSLIMCECLSTLSKGKVQNNRRTGLLGTGAGMSESASLPQALSFPTSSRGIGVVVCFC